MSNYLFFWLLLDFTGVGCVSSTMFGGKLSWVGAAGWIGISTSIELVDATKLPDAKELDVESILVDLFNNKKRWNNVGYRGFYSSGWWDFKVAFLLTCSSGELFNEGTFYVVQWILRKCWPEFLVGWSIFLMQCNFDITNYGSSSL